MITISVPFGIQWQIQIPSVIRYLEKQEYVDAFFRDGTLRLSSFEAFRLNPDEERGDQSEGFCKVHTRGPNIEGEGIYLMSQEAYILCGTVNEDPGLADRFGTTGLRILDSLAFASAVARYVPGCIGGIQGMCSYRSNTAAQLTLSEPYRPPGPDEDPIQHGKDLHRKLSAPAHDTFFYKALQFAHQAEYRFIWVASGRPGRYLPIKCPEAVGFCERLE